METRYQPGQQVQGIVTRITHFGVFVQLEPGLEGVIYTFELGQQADLAPGQQMQLYIKSIDVGRKRMELSMECRTLPDWLAEQGPPPLDRWDKTLPRAEQSSWPTPFLELHAPTPLTPPQALFTPSEQTCPTCQRAIQVAWKYCVYCGHMLRRRCSACGCIQPSLPEARYCSECGQRLL